MVLIALSTVQLCLHICKSGAHELFSQMGRLRAPPSPVLPALKASLASGHPPVQWEMQSGADARSLGVLRAELEPVASPPAAPPTGLASPSGGLSGVPGPPPGRGLLSPTLGWGQQMSLPSSQDSCRPVASGEEDPGPVSLSPARRPRGAQVSSTSRSLWGWAPGAELQVPPALHPRPGLASPSPPPAPCSPSPPAGGPAGLGALPPAYNGPWSPVSSC